MGLSAWKTNALKQAIEPWIGAEGVEDRPILQGSHEVSILCATLVQPEEYLIFLVQPSVDEGHSARVHRLTARQLQGSYQRFLSIAPPSHARVHVSCLAQVDSFLTIRLRLL